MKIRCIFEADSRSGNSYGNIRPFDLDELILPHIPQEGEMFPFPEGRYTVGEITWMEVYPNGQVLRVGLSGSMDYTPNSSCHIANG